MSKPKSTDPNDHYFLGVLCDQDRYQANKDPYRWHCSCGSTGRFHHDESSAFQWMLHFVRATKMRMPPRDGRYEMYWYQANVESHGERAADIHRIYFDLGWRTRTPDPVSTYYPTKGFYPWTKGKARPIDLFDNI